MFHFLFICITLSFFPPLTLVLVALVQFKKVYVTFLTSGMWEFSRKSGNGYEGTLQFWEETVCAYFYPSSLYRVNLDMLRGSFSSLSGPYHKYLLLVKVMMLCSTVRPGLDDEGANGSTYLRMSSWLLSLMNTKKKKKKKRKKHAKYVASGLEALLKASVN